MAKNSGGKARSQVVEKEKLVGNQSRKGEKLLVGKPVDGKKRKLEMEEIDLLKSSGQKRRRKPLILPEPESERDKHLDKKLIPNILLTSLEPDSGEARGREEGSPYQGVGEVFLDNNLAAAQNHLPESVIYGRRASSLPVCRENIDL